MILNAYNNLQASQSCSRLIMSMLAILYSISTIAILAIASQQTLTQGHQSEEHLNQLQISSSIPKDEYDLLEENLKPWILQEYKRNEKIRDFNGEQGFIIKIAPEGQYVFRRTCRQQFGCRMKIIVFVISDGEKVSIREPEQNSKIQILINKDLHSQFQSFASVYIFSIIEPKKFQGNFFKVKNLHKEVVFIQIQLEEEPIKIDMLSIAKNQKFSIALTKLKTIQQQLKRLQSTRKRNYKWQWGFLQRQNHNDYEMVKLTIGQLIVILITSIVEVYCIKSLFGNYHVV